MGCGAGIFKEALSPCVRNTYESIERVIGGSDRGDFGFSATGGTEIKDSYIDNSRGPMGSSFDLSQHDF